MIKEYPIACPIAEVDWFAGRFDEMVDLFGRTHPESRVAAINILETMILKVSALDRGKGGESGVVSKLREVLQEGNYATPHYDLLARELDVSTPTLRRRFRSENGISIHAFVQRERIEKARTSVFHLMSCILFGSSESGSKIFSHS